MMQIIDVLVVIDAETIINKFGKNTDSNNPVQVTDPNLIFMVTKRTDAVSGNGGNELKIASKRLDTTIRWKETSLSLISTYSALLYKFTATSGSNLISPPVSLLVTAQTPLSDPSNPAVPKIQTSKTYFWNCNVLKSGKVTYHFNFMILDRSGKVQGYYWWDFYIEITN